MNKKKIVALQIGRLKENKESRCNLTEVREGVKLAKRKQVNIKHNKMVEISPIQW